MTNKHISRFCAAKATFVPLVLFGMLFFLSSFLNFLAAQSLDSLHRVFATQSKSDTARGYTALTLAKRYLDLRPDSAGYYLEISEETFSRLQDYEGTSEASWFRFRFWMQQGELMAAKGEIQQRLMQNIAEKDESGAAWSRLGLGEVEVALGQYLPAQMHLQEAETWFEESRDSLGMGNAHLQLGLLHLKTGNLENTERHLLEAKEQLEAKSSHRQLSVTFRYLADLEVEKGNSSAAFAYFNQSLELARGFPEETGTLSDFGAFYLRTNDLPNSKIYYTRALTAAEMYHVPQGKISAYIGLGQFYVRNRQLGQAREYLHEALSLSEQLNSPADINRTLTVLIDLEKQAGNFEEALSHTDRFHSIRDSLSGLEKFKQLNELAVRYQSEKKETENQLLREREASARQRSRSILWTSLGGGAFLVVVATLLATLYSRKRRLSKIIGTKNEELETINQQLVSLNEEKDVLMGVVAHDLKSPLNKAGGLAQVLEIEGPLNPEQKQTLDRMQQVFDGGKKLIEELVFLSQLEAGEARIELKEEDLSMILRETLATFRPTASRKSIELRGELPTSPVIFSTQEESLCRVLDNLLSNAIKFSQPGTEVLLSLEVREDGKLISVKDQGPGIAPAEQKMLFRKFTRLSNRPTGGESSTGLGLYIARQLVEQLGGSIDVESAPGKGTTFYIHFPS